MDKRTNMASKICIPLIFFYFVYYCFFTHACISYFNLISHLTVSHQINAVRAVVPNKSNNEIALVLQHFENSVDRAVQAFVEGKTRSTAHLN